MALLAATMLTTGANAFTLGGSEITDANGSYNDNGAYVNNWAGYDQWLDIFDASEFKDAHKDGWVGAGINVKTINDGSQVGSSVLWGAAPWIAADQFSNTTKTLADTNVMGETDIIINQNELEVLTKTTTATQVFNNVPNYFNGAIYASLGYPSLYLADKVTYGVDKQTYLDTIGKALHSDAVYVQSAGINSNINEVVEGEWEVNTDTFSAPGTKNWHKVTEFTTQLGDGTVGSSTALKFVKEYNQANWSMPLDTSGLLIVGQANEDGTGTVDGTFEAGDFKHSYVVAQGNTASDATTKVGALAALLKNKFGTTKKQTADIIKYTATDLGAQGVDDVYGYGLVNVAAALNPIGDLN